MCDSHSVSRPSAAFNCPTTLISIRWPNEAGTEIYDFLKIVFAGMLERHSDLIKDDAKYEQFLDARRIAAKFWDDWARAIAKKTAEI
jgi:hypothetical protein